MRVVLAGGTGFIGSALARSLLDAGHEVHVFTRGALPPDPRARAVPWTPGLPGDWAASLSGAAAVVNLAGHNLFARRWSASVKEEIRRSRVETTRVLAAEIARASPRPAAFVSAGAVGYYGPHGDEDLAEDSPPGTDFLASVCRDWEDAARGAETRTVLLRIGVVLGRGGGALVPMARPFRFRFGGHVGSGEPWLSWVHLDDLVAAVRFAIDRPDLAGPVNATAPSPARMRDVCRAIGAALDRSSWCHVPGFMLRLILGEVADVLLTGQRAIPAALRRAGFTHRYADVESALRSLLTRAAVPESQR